MALIRSRLPVAAAQQIALTEQPEGSLAEGSLPVHSHVMHLISFIFSCRIPSTLRTPEWPRQDTELADPHLQSLPSAPPLPEAQADALYAASSAQSVGLGHAQHSFYPSLHESTHSKSALRPSQSQSRQHEAPSTGGQTGGGPLGPAKGQGGESAEATPAVQPAGSLKWAAQIAAGASSAAVMTLSAWLPWQHDSSTSRVPQQEQQLQSGISTRRCAGKFLIPGIPALAYQRS